MSGPTGFGGCCCACEESRAKWRNISRVDDYHLDGDCQPIEPNGVPPYPRRGWNNRAGEPPGSCIPADPDDCFTQERPACENSAREKCSNAQFDFKECAPEDATHDTFPNPPAGYRLVEIANWQPNCFEKTQQEQITVNVCGRIGFKNVQAVKVWHGLPPFTERDPWTADRLTAYADPQQCDCNFKSPPSFSQVRYLAQNINAWRGEILGRNSFPNYNDSPTNWPPRHSENADAYASFSTVVTVNRYSGDVTASEYSWPGPEDPNYGYWLDLVTDAGGYSHPSISGIVARFAQKVDQFRSGGYTLEFSANSTWTDVTVTVRNPSNNERIAVVEISTVAAHLRVLQGFDGTALKYDLINGVWELTGTEIIFCVTLEESAEFNATHSVYRKRQSSNWTTVQYIWSEGNPMNVPESWHDENGNPVHKELWPFYSGAEDTETEITSDLSSPYTVGDVMSDLYALLSRISLKDHYRYPWRTDEYVTRAPVVCRDENEVPSAPNYVPLPMEVRVSQTETQTKPWRLFGYYQWDEPLPPGRAYGDPRPCPWTGIVLGDLLPAGYESFFDPMHKVGEKCYDPESGNPIIYTRWVGRWSTSDGITPHATRWTERFNVKPTGEPRGEPPRVVPLGAGAWVWIKDGLFHAQKWAEIKLPFRGWNWFRPCGEDRYLVQNSTARCVQPGFTEDENSVSLQIYGTPNPFSVGDKVLFFNGTEYQERQVTSASGSSVTLGPKLGVAALSAPVNSDSQNQTGPFIGKLRFPTAWPICGEIAIQTTSGQGVSPIQITLAEPAPWLRTGDRVDISGVQGNTAANGTNLQVTVIDSTHFTIPGTGNGDYAGGGMVRSTGAPDPQWNSDAPTGTYLVFTWKGSSDQWRWADEVCQSINYPSCANCPADAKPSLPQGVTCHEPYGQGNGWYSTMRWNVGQNLGATDPQVLGRDVYELTINEYSLQPGTNRAIVVCAQGDEAGWTNSNVHTFLPPAQLVFADVYNGSWYWSVPIQATIDPLWEDPPRPCVSEENNAPLACQFLPDDWALCPNNDLCTPLPGEKWWFPHPRLIEARKTKPSGAPDPPPGVFVDWLTWTDLNQYPPPNTGRMPQMPSVVGRDWDEWENVTVWTPWGTWIRMKNCACGVSPGRFAEHYKRSIDCNYVL